LAGTEGGEEDRPHRDRPVRTLVLRDHGEREGRRVWRTSRARAPVAADQAEHDDEKEALQLAANQRTEQQTDAAVGAQNHHTAPRLYFAGYTNPLTGVLRQAGIEARAIAHAFRREKARAARSVSRPGDRTAGARRKGSAPN
jgi:hypothetical protein